MMVGKNTLGMTLALVLPSCGGTQPADEPTQPRPSRPAVVEVSPQPSAESEAAPPRPSAETPQSALRLVRSLCDAVASGNTDFVGAHAQLPLRGQEVISKEGAELMVSGVGSDEKPSSLKYRAMCKHPPDKGGALSEFEVIGKTTRGFLEFGGHRYRLGFERDPARLVEQSYVLADVPLPKRTPTDRPFHINIDPRSDHGQLDRRLARRAHGQLVGHPNCIEAQAAIEPTGVSLSITVQTRANGPAEVNLYASTVGSASYLGCLQAQLRPVLQQVVAEEKTPRLHRLWAMVGIVLYDHEIDKDAPMITMDGE